jgi:hypothetical protein
VTQSASLGVWPTLVGRLRRSPSLAVPLLVLALGFVAYYAVYHLHYANGPPVRSDGEGYYAYIPAYLLNHDDSFISLINGHFAEYQKFDLPPSVFGFTLQPTGHYLDKYPVGEAILIMPFFAVGHVIALAAGLKANGYSNPELYAAGTAGLIYTVLGLFALRAVLRRWFTEWVTVATLVAVTFGTSVFHYATYDSIFSHAFSFFAVSLTLLLAIRWYEQPRSAWRAVLLGLAAGAVVAIRFTDAAILLGIPLLMVGSLAALRERGRLLWDNRLRLTVIAGCGALTLIPQIVSWWLATRHLIAPAYAGEPFYFRQPQMLASLFSFNPHGLLPYAPVLCFAFVGLGLAWVRRRDIALPVTLAFLPAWYIISSWWDWSFTAGFGDRAFNNVLPFLALPLALFFASVLGWKTRLLVAAVSALMIGVTLVQMVNYWQGRLGFGGVGPREFLRLLFIH